MSNTKLLACLIILFSFVAVFNLPHQAEASVTRTKTFTADQDDGYAYENDFSYSVLHAMTSAAVNNYYDWWRCGQSLNGSSLYWIRRAFVFFDTDLIPDGANITAVILSLYLHIDQSVTDFDVTVQNGQPIYPHQPLEGGDFYRDYYSGDGGALDTSTFSGSAYYNLTFNADGRSWVQDDGYTKLCLRSDREIAQTTPTGHEYVEFYSAEEGSNYSPKLYVTYETEGWEYILYGAYDEEGQRDGAINCTFYRPTESAVNFELDGSYSVDAEWDTRMVFRFDLGYNESRVYYITDRFEEIYVFKPSEPYYTYYFTVIDYVGMTNAYLETLLAINGTEIVVERWRLDVLNDIPFTLSWGVAYKVRVVCDEGTYMFGTFVAGATTDFTFTVTQEMFPSTATHIGNISVSALRMAANWIQINYSDAANQTNWVYVRIYKLTGSSVVYSTNNTGYTQQINWYDADNLTDYKAKVTVGHSVRGELSWMFVLPALEEAKSNPFTALSILGSFPVGLEQMASMALVLMVFGSFSYVNRVLGVLVPLLLAGFLIWMGWLAIGWAWFSLTIGIGILVAISMSKQQGGVEV